MPRLRRSDCSTAGLARRRRGRGFEYLDQNGRGLRNKAALERIHSLAIPPAWNDVWICADELGHLQATGVDAAGRKQYRYHDQWRTGRDRAKFDEMLDFAASLPAMRRRVARDLRREELDRRRVLACSIRLLDLGFFRIGSESSAEQMETYGLTTMRRDHVSVNDDLVTFDYDAKGGQHRIQSVADDPVREIVCDLKRRRSANPGLLAYREGRRWREVSAEEVNSYLKEICGEQFSAKDFRTWNATVLAAVALGSEPPAGSKAARKRAVSAAMKTVAAYLGNTPAVARSSYVDPRVVDRYVSGWTIGPLLADVGEGPDLSRPRIRSRLEEGVLDLLTDRETDAVERTRS